MSPTSSKPDATFLLSSDAHPRSSCISSNCVCAGERTTPPPFMISIRNPENLFHFWSGSDIVLWACEISFMPQSATSLPPKNMSRCLPFLTLQMQIKSDVVRCVQWDVFRRTNGPEASAPRPGGAFGLPQMACDVLLLYLMACFERPCVGAVDSLTKRSGWSSPVYHRAWVRAFNDGKV